MTALRIRYVEGVNPARWLAVWEQRHPASPAEHERVEQPVQFDAVLAGEADVAIVRGEVTDARLHRVRLFDEQMVVVGEREHALAAFDELTAADLDGETLLDLATLSFRDGIAVAATGAGLAVVPMSVARLYGGRATITRPLTDAPPQPVSLVWLRDRDSDTIQDFVGVARGRTAISSRGESPESEPAKQPAKHPGKQPQRERPRKPRPAHRIAPKSRPKRRRGR